MLMKNKIVLIGLGNVGNSYIYSLLMQKINIEEIAIIDINEKNTKGEMIANETHNEEAVLLLAFAGNGRGRKSD